MAKRKRNSNTLTAQKLGQHGMKIILGLIATGSFAIAFGEEQIQKIVSGNGSNQNCLEQFYHEAPPYLNKESLKKDSYALCFNGFNVMYSGVSKTPLWVAEYLSPERLNTKIPREDNFHEEMRVAKEHRATLQDYRGSGSDRGHMAPNADMSTKAAQYDSFSLANMVPQAPKNNQQVWRELEEATRAVVTKHQQDVYVVTGPVYKGKTLKTIGNGVIIPTAVYKAVYMPKSGVIGAYYAPNDNSQQVHVVSVCYLEEMLGINLFPQLSEDKKRNTYNLPLNLNQVKVKREINYLNWDAESQCAEDVNSKTLNALKKEFKGENTTVTVNDDSPSVPENSSEPSLQESIIRHLLDELFNYLRRLL